MILKETLTEVVKSQKENLLNSDPGILREKIHEIRFSPGFAVIISGIRRSGKSTLLRQLIEKTKVFNYINFEDVRVFNFDVKDFNRLDEVFSSQSKSDFYFFDEIQNVNHWEKYIRTLLDRKKNVVITGSNASLLSKELGTKLTGRHLRFELLPFSYNEYLVFRNEGPSFENFEGYLHNGGFPEYLKLKNEMILQELFNDIIVRDITVRYNLRNPKLVKEMALYLLSNVGREFTFQRLKKTYDLGSVNTVISLIGYYEDSYLLFTVPQFDYSYRKQLVNPKKIYAVDTGLIRANSVSFSDSLGYMLENIVFIHLKRMGKEVFYYKRKHECDFISRASNKALEAFQVCYELNEDNKDREINGLIEAMDYLKIKSAVILTHNQTDELDIDNKKILIKPVFNWLIENR